MSFKRLIMVAALVAGSVGTLAYVLARPKSHLQAKVFVEKPLWEVKGWAKNRSGFGSYAQLDWLHDFKEVCPHAAFLWPAPEDQGQEADYLLSAEWQQYGGKQGWGYYLQRKDKALLMLSVGELEPDRKQILRKACPIIEKDFPAWLSTGQVRAKLEALESQASKPTPLRYELHEVRNGPVVSTALLDKQAGVVWTLRADKAGKITGFEEHVVYPSPAEAASKAAKDFKFYAE